MTDDRQGSRVSFLACSRNVGALGISMVIDGVIRAGTPCEVMLDRLDGTTVALRGTVVRCFTLEAGIHEIGIGFDHKIDLDQYVAPGQSSQAGL